MYCIMGTKTRSNTFLGIIRELLPGMFVWVEEYCTFGDRELNAVIFFFFGLNFVGAIVRNLEVIIF